MATEAASGRDFVNLSKWPYNISPSQVAATNTAQLIQAAVDHCKSTTVAGKKLYLPSFTSACPFNTTTLTRPAFLVGDGFGGSWMQFTAGAGLTWSAFRWRSSWSGSGATTLSVQLNQGDTVITGIGSTSGWAAGDWVCIGASVAAGEVNGTNSGAFMGEWARIKSVDSATQITIWGPLEETYPTTFTAKITRKTFWQGCGIEGITLDNSQPGTSPAVNDDVDGAMCVFRGLDRPRMDVEITNGSGTGFALDTCRDAEGTVNVRDLLDNPTTGELGYACLLWNGTQGGHVRVFATRCRHGVTTGGEAMGIPRHVTLSGKVEQNSGTAWDTHAEGRYIIFDNCHVENQSPYAFSSDASSAFQFRAPNTIVKGGEVFQATGWAIQSSSSGTDCEVDGLTIRNMLNHPSLGSGDGIDLKGARSVVKNCHIIDPSPSGGGFVCVQMEGDGQTVSNNTFRRSIGSGGSPVNATSGATNGVVANNIARGTWGATFVSGTTTGIHGGAAGDNNLIVA